MQSDLLCDILFEKRRQEHAKGQRELFNRYVEQPKQVKTNRIISFSQWHNLVERNSSCCSYEAHQTLFLDKQQDLQEGGFFVCLKQLGIVINPGPCFFRSFCEKGYSLADIDVIIATYSDPLMLQAVEEIQLLNQATNQKLASYGQEPHLIRFYLHPELYTGQFKPQFRQERASIHLLETFGQREESYWLDANLGLAYMPASSGSYAIRLDDFENRIHLGCIMRGGIQDGLQELFMPCTILLGGIGRTSIEDLEFVAYEKHSLGLFGMKRLIETGQNLQLVLLAEFSRAMGDLRIELLQKLQSSCQNGPQLLPVDAGLSIDLNDETILCENGAIALRRDVRAIRPFGPFHRLMYVANEDLW